MPTVPPPAPKNKQHIAAIKAHITRHQEALDRWTRRLKRAATEVCKHQAKLRYQQKQLEKENGT
jgi:hypothetical protein